MRFVNQIKLQEGESCVQSAWKRAWISIVAGKCSSNVSRMYLKHIRNTIIYTCNELLCNVIDARTCIAR